MLLTGTYLRTLDDKQRMVLPRSVREALGGPTSAVLYATPGTDGSVALYPESSFAQLAQQLQSLSPTAFEVRAFSRLFYAQAQRVEVDRQGRIRIPQELMKLGGLERELVLVGVRDHLELWNKARWDEYLARQQASYDQIAEMAFGALAGPTDRRQPVGVGRSMDPGAINHVSVEQGPVVRPETDSPPGKPR